MGSTARQTHLQVPHEISLRVGFATPAAGVLGGWLGKGWVLNATHVAVATAFNSTTNTLSVGYTVGGGQLVNAIDLKAVARTDTVVPIANVIVQNDTPLYYTLGSTGGAPTAGDAVFWLDFIPNIG